MSKRRGDSQVLPVHFVISAALTGGVVQYQLSPSGIGGNSSRLASVADNWAHFRVTQCKFRVHHGAITGDVSVGYVGGVQDNLPATGPLIMELLPSVRYGSTYTVPSEWVNIPKKDLAGPFPWYKALNGAADSTEEAPGYICVAGTGTDTPVLEFRAVFEFKTAVGPANTPAAVELAAKLRKERELETRQAARKQFVKLLNSATVGFPSA